MTNSNPKNQTTVSIIIIVYILFFSLATTLVSCLNQEGLYLYQLKLSLDDPDSKLSSWNSRDATPCNWYGVTCDATTNTTVTELDLSDTNIGGPFLSNILYCLPKVIYVNLFNNSINETLPSEISLCKNLIHLDLSQNLLNGPLPNTLPQLLNLRYLDLTGNNFFGPILDSFATFQNLEVLSLVSNLLEDRNGRKDVDSSQDNSHTMLPIKSNRLCLHQYSVSDIKRHAAASYTTIPGDLNKYIRKGS
ncbi:Receptor-like protein kinase HSL1 [Glycine soja]